MNKGSGNGCNIISDRHDVARVVRRGLVVALPCALGWTLAPCVGLASGCASGVVGVVVVGPRIVRLVAPLAGKKR